MDLQYQQRFEEITLQISTLQSQHTNSIDEIKTEFKSIIEQHDHQICSLQQFTAQIDIIEFKKASKTNDDAISQFKDAVECSQKQFIVDFKKWRHQW